MKIENYEFKPVGIDGIYISDGAILKAPFDKDDCNDWEKSSGKKLLEQWFKERAPAEIQERFDIDLPTVEEVFSQKMINWRGGNYVKGLVSKQFPIFKDSDERMKEFEGKPTWWWTRSAHAGHVHYVWDVSPEGSIYYNTASYTYGFVPVLRRKRDKGERRMGVTLTIEDISYIKCHCLKDGNKELLDKVLEIEDWCHFHNQSDGITLNIDWRKDREEENE